MSLVGFVAPSRPIVIYCTISSNSHLLPLARGRERERERERERDCHIHCCACSLPSSPHSCFSSLYFPCLPPSLYPSVPSSVSPSFPSPLPLSLLLSLFQPLVQCYNSLKKTEKVFSLQISETWTRYYQVCPLSSPSPSSPPPPSPPPLSPSPEVLTFLTLYSFTVVITENTTVISCFHSEWESSCMQCKNVICIHVYTYDCTYM